GCSWSGGRQPVPGFSERRLAPRISVVLPRSSSSDTPRLLADCPWSTPSRCYSSGMLDPGWLGRYWEDGFAVIRGVFPRAQISELGGYFDEIFASTAGMREVTKHHLAEFRVLPIA